MNDFLSDMLIRIKNGQRAGLDAVVLHPAMPRYCAEVLEVLYKEGYLSGFKEYYDSKTNMKRIKVYLKYNANGAPAIQNVFRVSTPGRRTYLSTKVLWKPKTTSGVFLLSTPKGVMVDRDARLLNLGGELLCGIY